MSGRHERARRLCGDAGSPPSFEDGSLPKVAGRKMTSPQLQPGAGIAAQGGDGPGGDPATLLADIFRPGEARDVAAVLSLREVTVQFGGVAALRDVTFDVAPHDVVAVVGPNGAGKSTLLNVVSGLIRPTGRGDVTLLGEPLRGKSVAAVARLGVGRSFQSPPFIDTETVLQNVMVGQHLRLGYHMGAQLLRRRHVRALERAAERQALDVLEFVGVAELAASKIDSLPYGTRKLIDIARAIVSGPELLLLDEPTSGLDGDEQIAVGRILMNLHRATPVTVLVVEHHMDVVRAVANTVIGLHAGAVVAVGPPDEVLASESFRAALVGDPVEEPAASPSPAAHRFRNEPPQGAER
jgi:ABC-type branched-subunit amino acid transport system ATPase component